jgi:hypothetical protein
MGCFGFVKPKVMRAGEPEQGGNIQASHPDIPGCDGGGVHFYQDFIVFGAGFSTSWS